MDSVTVEREPSSQDVQFLEDRINEFNMSKTGIGDGNRLASVVRDHARQIVAGIYGWTWGDTREIRFLQVKDDTNP